MDRRHFLKTSAGVAGLTIAAPYIARAATITMRFAHFAEEGHPANIAAKQFASQIEKRTDGAIKIAIFPNNQLGGPPEQAQQIKLGTIDMGLPTQGQLDKYDKAFATIELPFIFNGPRGRLPDSRRPGDGLAGAARGEAGLCAAAQLGIRLPQRHQQRAPDQCARRHEGPEDPHPARTADPGLDGSARRGGDRPSPSPSFISRYRRRWSTAKRTRSR